jgi:SpoVK/Ycf46/Vps4 family AAA+-type ATPase
MPGPILVSADDRLGLGRRPSVSIEVPRSTAAERRALWQEALTAAWGRAGRDTAAIPGEELIAQLVSWFDLEAPEIHAACAMALASAGKDCELGTRLWESCRERTRSRLEGLVERIAPAAAWDELVLPEASLQQLRRLAASLRHRSRVHDAWGFSERGARGLGVGALFVGPSGTGKTLAAEVLAAELRLDLHRIDLSQVVSKYIGETEKNLRRIFEAAERGSAILLFDEADALFGRRGEVRSGQDRYANLEVAYLLQRMEAYRGLAILTTNLESALDPAFLRRLRFVVRFPLPGAAERAGLWRRAFPLQTPTEGLDIERLAQLGLTGGSIRNTALRAAFLAVEAGTPVRMEHVLEAAQAEYEKLGRVPGRAEVD